MKYFVALLLVSAVASAKNINVKAAPANNNNNNNNYMAAEARDSFHGSTSNTVASTSGWDSPVTTTFIEPAYTTSYAVPAASYATPAVSYAAPAAPAGLGIFGNFNFGLPGIVNTALTVVLALLAVSMLTDVITKLSTFPIFDKILGDDGRSLNKENLAEMAHYAIEAVNKLNEVYGSQ